MNYKCWSYIIFNFNNLNHFVVVVISSQHLVVHVLNVLILMNDVISANVVIDFTFFIMLNYEGVMTSQSLFRFSVITRYLIL